MSNSAAFGEQLDALGIWWPRGDGDAMRDAANAWTEVADFVEEIAVVLDTMASSLAENHRGEAAERFAELWQQWSGQDGHLPDTVADCRRLAAALADFGTDIDVADRTLLSLIEAALEASPEATVVRHADWLRTHAAGVGRDLAARASARGDRVSRICSIGEPLSPSERGTIDPGRVSWPDPGDPDDLSFLATDEVDFGAGQGTLPHPSPIAPPPGYGNPPPGSYWPGGPYGPTIPLPPGTSSPGGMTIIIEALNSTINIDGAGGGGGYEGIGGIGGVDPDPGADGIDPHPALDGVDPGPAIDGNTNNPDPGGSGGPNGSALGAGAALGGGAGLSAGAALAGLGGSGPSATSGGDSPKTPSIPKPSGGAIPSGDLGLPDGGTPRPVPIDARVPDKSPGTPLPSGIAGSGAANAAGGGGGGKSGRMPFMPMAPMGGAMGGEDGEEPRRRSVKK